MNDETAERAEGLALMIAATVRLSQMLDITLDDAAALVQRFGKALEAAEAVRRSAH